MSLPVLRNHERVRLLPDQLLIDLAVTFRHHAFPVLKAEKQQRPLKRKGESDECG